jgi:hypothetical protein
MRNNYEKKYAPFILNACGDERDKVRTAARLFRSELGL